MLADVVIGPGQLAARDDGVLYGGWAQPPPLSGREPSTHWEQVEEGILALGYCPYGSQIAGHGTGQ